MQRTDTTNRTLFVLPPPESATFDFSTHKNILITIPETSKWREDSHWHSPGQENCLLLHVETGEFQVSYHKQPRTGGVVLGAGDFKFRPEYWTGWSQKQGLKKETAVRMTVTGEGLQRNICSATLDAAIFPYLTSTPLSLRAIFAVLRLLPPARRWLVAKMLYVQLQIIYREHGRWEYHSGINALRWWQWTHPFNVGRHPKWTASLQYRSQKVFSRVVQGLYYWMGTQLFGMRGDYLEYNPQYGNSLEVKQD